MKKKLYTIAVLLALAITVTSCLGDGNEAEITVYDDTAMSSFSLSAVNRIVHTTSKSGADSVYRAKLSVASYPFTIDQYQRKIYNLDSLPADCDVKHVLVTAAATAYSGIIGVKSTTSDSVAYYSSSDSLDFTSPRIFRIFNNTGSKYRDYEVRLNVKTKVENQTNWTRMPEGTALPTTPTTGWDFRYNIEGNGIQSSKDNWTTIIDETLDEDPRLLPNSSSASFVSWNLGDGSTYALLAGNCDAQDKYMTVWRKVIDNQNPTNSGWVFIPIESNNNFGLPKLENYQSYFLLPYTNGKVLAIDGNGVIYQSVDQGITWKIPTALQPTVSNVKSAATDGKGGIWLLEDEGGKDVVWYGREK